MRVLAFVPSYTHDLRRESWFSFLRGYAENSEHHFFIVAPGDAFAPTVSKVPIVKGWVGGTYGFFYASVDTNLVGLFEKNGVYAGMDAAWCFTPSAVPALANDLDLPVFLWEPMVQREAEYPEYDRSEPSCRRVPIPRSGSVHHGGLLGVEEV